MHPIKALLETSESLSCGSSEPSIRFSVVVAETVGAAEGAGEGLSLVGAEEGWPLGAFLGAAEGWPLDAKDGLLLGTEEG
jgi:hypothetical protein